MNEALLISNIVLWLVVVGLAMLVAMLTRQIGILYERVAPAGALSLARGPEPGEAVPIVPAKTLDGATLEVGSGREDGRSTLVVFVSPTCPVCKELLPVLRSMAEGERSRLEVMLASDGVEAEHRAYVRAHHLESLPYVVSPSLGITWKVPRLPWAVLVGADGVLRARGLVNSREHLESLLEAEDRGVSSLQEFLETHYKEAS
jgi:methylamine dehydrogenase accessory protein MauD